MVFQQSGIGRNFADQRAMGHETLPLGIDLETGTGQDISQATDQFAKRRYRSLRTSPQQMVMPPVAQPVEDHGEGWPLNAIGQGAKFRQARLRHLAKESQRQMDGIAACRSSAKVGRRVGGYFGEAVGHIDRRPKSEKNSGRCRPLLLFWPAFSRHVPPGPPPAPRSLPRDPDSPGVRWSCP